MTLIASLAVLLLCAHLFGWLAERFGQPALAGQMIAGVVAGPAVLGVLTPGPSLAAISDLAVIFVVITAALELRMQHLLHTFRGKGLIGLLLGLLIPAAATIVFALAMQLAWSSAIVVALCVSVTALPVALRILGAFGLLRTRVARVAIASSLLADVIVLLVLSVMVALSQDKTSGGWVAGSVAAAKLALLLLTISACHIACVKLSRGYRSREAQHPIDNVLIFVLLFMFGLGTVSEWLGFHFVIGVFFASLLVTRELIGETRFASLERTCELTSITLFAPLFLAYQGIQFETSALGSGVLVLGLIAVAIISKLLGGYAAARLQVLPHFEACGVAIIMNARGLMEMVIASIAYRGGLIDQKLFSALLVVGIVTTVITPVLLKRWLRNEPARLTMISVGENGA
jgi:Kef-type K+ transport system membrane component KefB